MTATDKRVAEVVAAFERDMEEVFTGAAIGGLIVGKPLPLMAMASAADGLRPNAKVWAGLEETEDGGWAPTIFFTERLPMWVEHVQATVKIG